MRHFIRTRNRHCDPNSRTICTGGHIAPNGISFGRGNPSEDITIISTTVGASVWSNRGSAMMAASRSGASFRFADAMARRKHKGP